MLFRSCQRNTRHKCLVQATVAQYLLKKRGIATTLYLGVCKGEDGEMKAHAWLRYGQWLVTGAGARRGYQEVARFSNQERIKIKKERKECYEKVA